MAKLIQPKVFYPGRTFRVVLILLLLFVWAGIRERRNRQAEEQWVLAGAAFGSTYMVKFSPGPPLAERDEIRAGIENLLQSVDDALSTYRPDSELARFNQSSTTNAVPVGPILARVLEIALKIGKASDGALDITCAPLVDAWRFDEDTGALKPPSEDILKSAQRLCGLDKIVFDGKSLRKTNPGTRLNVNAVAPGLAADLLRENLAGKGFSNLYIDVGGEALVSGHKADGKPWRIGIQRPELSTPVGGRPMWIVELQNQALATSGDYRHFRLTEGGKVAAHIFDPRKGGPLIADWASVSVTAPTCGEADAWATAMFVLGPEEGLRLLAERAPGIEAMYLLRDGEQFNTLKSPGFLAIAPENE